MNAAAKGGKKTARSPTAAKTAEKASSVHMRLKKAKRGGRKKEEDETESRYPVNGRRDAQ